MLNTFYFCRYRIIFFLYLLPCILVCSHFGAVKLESLGQIHEIMALFGLYMTFL